MRPGQPICARVGSPALPRASPKQGVHQCRSRGAGSRLGSSSPHVHCPFPPALPRFSFQRPFPSPQAGSPHHPLSLHQTRPSGSAHGCVDAALGSEYPKVQPHPAHGVPGRAQGCPQREHSMMTTTRTLIATGKRSSCPVTDGAACSFHSHHGPHHLAPGCCAGHAGPTPGPQPLLSPDWVTAVRCVLVPREKHLSHGGATHAGQWGLRRPGAPWPPPHSQGTFSRKSGTRWVAKQRQGRRVG